MTLLLPDGQRLITKKIEDLDFPQIGIYLENQNGEQQKLCFAEYNSEKPVGEKICIRVYDSKLDEPRYYSSLLTNKETPLS